MSPDLHIQQQLEAAQAQIQQLVAERDADRQTQAQLQSQLDQQQRHIAQLEAQTHRLQWIVNTSPAITYSCQADPPYACTYISQSIEAVLGYTPDEFKAKPDFWEQRLHPEDAPSVLAAIPKLFEQGRLQHDYRMRHRDGYYIWMRDELILLRDAQGLPQEVVGYFTDISDQKRLDADRKQTEHLVDQELQRIAEENRRFRKSLTAQEATYRHLFDCNPQPMWVFDLETLSFLAVNDAAVAKYGYSRAEFLAMTIADIRPSQDLPRLLENVAQVDSGLDMTGIWQHYLRDGQIIQVEIVSYALEFEGRRAKLVMAQDVTQRVEAEQALHDLNRTLEQTVAERTADLYRNQAEVRAILNHSPAKIYVEDLEGRYTFVNQTFLDLYGCTQADILGKTIHEVFSSDIADAFRANDLRLLEQGVMQPVEERVRANGEDRYFLSHKFLLRDDQGEVYALCGMSTDITDRKAMEVDLQESRDRMQAMVSALPDHVFRVNGDGLYLDFYPSDSAIEITGLDTLVGRTIPEVLPPDIAQADLHRIAAALSTQTIHVSEQQVEVGGVQLVREIRVAPCGPNEVLFVIRDITDRKQAEIALRDLTNRLTLALQAGDYGTWTWDLAETLNWDDQTYQIFGRQNLDHPITAAEWLALVHPDDLATIDDQIPAVLAGEKDFQAEFRIYWPNGELRWVQGYAQVQRDDQGNPVQLVGITRDITSRKQQSLALETYALEVEDLYNNAPCGYYSLDAEGRVTRINNTALGWIDHRREAVLGQPITQFMTADSCQIFEERRAMLAHSGQVRSAEYEITLLGSDGGYMDVLVSEQVQKDAEGDILSSRATLTDIRQRLKTENMLKRQFTQEKLLRAMTQHIRQSLDLQQILATVTQQVKQLLGCDRVIVFRLFDNGQSRIEEEAVDHPFPALKGQNWGDEVWPQDILDVYWQGQPRIVPDVMDDRWTDCLQDYSRQGQVQSKIVAPILSDLFDAATHRWVGPDQDHKLWGVLVVHACQEKRHWQPSEAQLLQQIADQLAIAIQQASLFEQLQQELSDRKQIELDLQHTNTELARATRLKDEFLANMSHELRTPLNAILGMTEGLQEEVFGLLTDRQRRSLTTIETSSNHLLSLINDVLDVAKIESGQIELDYAAVNVGLLCNSSLTLVNQQAYKKRLHLETQLAKNLPEIYGDERRLRQVIVNLLSNAIKFTPEGGRITVTASYTDLTAEEIALNRELIHPERDPTATVGILSLSVADTGIGISPESAKKLFQPFIQIDSALNRQHQGTGLGLALVKQITEIHGGKVTLTSESGCGSCFTLQLPIVALPTGYSPAIASTTAIEAFSPLDSVTAPLDSATDPLILLAEDNDANVNTTTAYLTAKGYHLVIAKNGVEAVNLATSTNPDLILMDIQMPQLDGLSAIRQIRQNSALANVPIVAVTALAMPEDRDRCLAAGADEYISKPIRLRQLSQVIQTLLAKRSPQ